jgi:hypothetical protein
MCELLVGLPDVNVLAVDDQPDGPIVVHIEARREPAWCRGCGVRARVTAGPGGDRTCDQNEPDESEDGLVFVLPRAYRPAFFDASGLANGIVITSDAAVLNGNPIPPGGVVSLLDGTAALDGVSFQAASATQAASSPAEISLRKLRQLGGK